MLVSADQDLARSNQSFVRKKYRTGRLHCFVMEETHLYTSSVDLGLVCTMFIVHWSRSCEALVRFDTRKVSTNVETAEWGE